MYFSGSAIDITNAIATAPLPTFSPYVRQFLCKDKIPERIWSLVISETAYYYLGNWPTINDSSQYRHIGMKMFSQYPAIGLDGKHPWVCITCMSIRLFIEID